MATDPNRVLRINPSFFRCTEEAQIVGRIVVAFGELEYLFCATAGNVTQKSVQVLRALYRLRVTSARLSVADCFIRPYAEGLGLKNEYDTAWAALGWCLSTRNRYAHCNWADDRNGLYYTDLQDSSERSEGFDHHWFHVDTALLREQEEYFEYTQDWIDYVAHKLNELLGLPKAHVFPKPKVRGRPPDHNPPLTHVPTWISAEQQALHVERARAAEEGRPTPTPAQKAQEVAKAKKLAEKAKRDRKSQKLDPKRKKKK